MKLLLSALITLLVWPCILWIVGCSLISFVSWNNYFIVNVSEWDGVVRLFYILASLICVGALIIKTTTAHYETKWANEGEKQ